MYDRQTVGASVGDMPKSSLVAVDYATEPPRVLPSQNGRSELASVLDAQEKAAYTLIEMVKALADKLGPVLSPSPASNGTEASAPAYGSSVANCIQTNTIRMHAATEMLQRLMHDLAV